MRENYTLKRLYIETPLNEDESVILSKDQSHYVANVLRMKAGQALRLFNGENGEWRAEIETLTKKQVSLILTSQIRPPLSVPDIRLAFAPVRRHRTAFIFEKATELGVARFEPVITDRTQFPKINFDKARAQIIEAAEQTERLDIPGLSKTQPLRDWLQTVSGRTILFADEAGDAQTARDVVQSVNAPVTLLIGPEGGFSETERTVLREHGSVRPLSLGPRILRADTAALSLLTLWQAVKGDWV